jgi:hypothetical protein
VVSCRRLVEVAVHDLGFPRVDAALTADRLAGSVVAFHHVVAVAETTAALAGFDPPPQTTPRLVGEILEEQRIHRAFEADVQVRVSPSDNVMIFTPAKAMRSKTPATSSWSRLIRSSASASTTSKRPRSASAKSA